MQNLSRLALVLATLAASAAAQASGAKVTNSRALSLIENIPIESGRAGSPFFGGPLIDGQVLAELAESEDGVAAQQLRIAETIVTSPFGQPHVKFSLQAAISDEEFFPSPQFTQAYWALGVDLLARRSDRVDAEFCGRLNRVLGWGLHAGLRHRFEMSSIASTEVKDRWARLIVTLNQGVENRAIAAECRDTLHLARSLWRYSLAFRSFEGSYFSGLDGKTISERVMIWWDDRDSPYVVSLNYRIDSKFIALGTLDKRPPAGRWNRDKGTAER